MKDSCVDTLVINGVNYVKASDVKPVGNRAVIVVDRGWVFAGDVTRANGRITLTRAVWVFNWSAIGFDGVLKDPKSKNVQIRKMDHVVDMPDDTEIFSIPVDANWGL